MIVDLPDFRPRTTFDMKVMTPRSIAGGFSMIASVGILGFVLFVLIPRLALAAGILEPKDLGREPEPVVEEPQVIQAAFVQLGRHFDPRELPDRQVSRSTLAPRQRDPNVVSQLTREVTDAGVQPMNAHESMLSQLGNRAEFIERTSIAEMEGEATGAEEARRGEGSLFIGQIVTLMKRGLGRPPNLADAELASLNTGLVIVVNQDLTIQSIRISRPSGNADFDRAVQDRIDAVMSSHVVLSPPDDSERDTVLGRPLGFVVVPPGGGGRRRPAATQTPAPGASALDRLGAGYNTGE